MRRKLVEMNLIDDYLMTCVAGDPEVGEPCCRRMLSVLLQREISSVHITTQRVIPGADTDLRGIRMDVEVEEKIMVDGAESVANIYDIEPHTRNDLDFPRHNRFYQARNDSKRLKSGEKDFGKLPNLYVITITNFDLFGVDQMVYTFRNHCEEVPELRYEDGLCYVYFNTQGKKGGSQAIRNMLDYIQHSEGANAADDAPREIDSYVAKVKADPLLEEGTMTLGYYFDREREEGRLEDRVEAITELLEDIGTVPPSIPERLTAITDMEELKRLHKVAAKAKSIETFEAELPEVTIQE